MTTAIRRPRTDLLQHTYTSQVSQSTCSHMIPPLRFLSMIQPRAQVAADPWPVRCLHVRVIGFAVTSHRCLISEMYYLLDTGL